jgi:hypothetical protein
VIAMVSVSALDVDVCPSRETSLPPTFGQKLIIEFSRRFGLGNGAVRKWGAKLATSLREGAIDYDYHGLTLRMDPTSCGSTRHMLMSPSWSDCRERAFLLDRLPNRGVFIDIGANAGFYSFFAAGHRHQARIIAFEPVKRWADTLMRNVDLNHLDRMSVENVALSDKKDGTVEIEGEAYPTATLLAALMRHAIERIDVLKIDIEGMEDKVLVPFLRDAPRSLWPRAILGEHIFTSQWRDECLRRDYKECWRTSFNSALVLDHCGS